MCDLQTRSLTRAFASRLKYAMNIKLLTEHHLEFLSLKGGCTGSSESILVKNATLLESSCRCSYVLTLLNVKIQISHNCDWVSASVL